MSGNDDELLRQGFYKIIPWIVPFVAPQWFATWFWRYYALNGTYTFFRWARKAYTRYYYTIYPYYLRAIT